MPSSILLCVEDSRTPSASGGKVAWNHRYGFMLGQPGMRACRLGGRAESLRFGLLTGKLAANAVGASSLSIKKMPQCHSHSKSAIPSEFRRLTERDYGDL